MNSRPQTAGSAGFKCNEIVALEESYNLTVQAHDLDAGRWKRLVETLLSQLGVDLLERNRIGAMRPVSNTMGRQLAAFANSSAIACAIDAVWRRQSNSIRRRVAHTPARKRRLTLQGRATPPMQSSVSACKPAG